MATASQLRENAIVKLATVEGISAKETAATTLFTVPTGKTMVVDHVVIRVTDYTAGSKNTQAVASFGGNHATYDDYLDTVTYTVAAADKAIVDSLLDAAIPVYAAGTNFKFIVEVASNATLEKYAIDLFGYLY